MRTLLTLLVVAVLYTQPVINPDNVRPGEWFTPTQQTQKMETENE
jgi:hypothetical protein